MLTAMPYLSQRGLITGHEDGGVAVPPKCPCGLRISIHTERNQHIDCVEARLTPSDNGLHLFRGAYKWWTCEYGTLCGVLEGWPCDITPGVFYLQVRWRSGHSPYPEIDLMTIYVGGVKVRDDEPIPKVGYEGGDYETVARIEITGHGDTIVERVGGPITEDDLQ